MGDRLGTQGAVGILVPDMKVLEGLLIVSELFLHLAIANITQQD